MPQRNSSNSERFTVVSADDTAIETLSSADSPAKLEVSTATGMVTALILEMGEGFFRRPLSASLGITVGGSEKRDPTGGLTYEDTTRWSGPNLAPQTSSIHKGVCHEFQKKGQLNGLELTFHYRLFPSAPYVEVALTLAAPAQVLVRNIDYAIHLPESSNDLLNVPGNMIHRNLPVAELGERPLGVSPIGGLRGSSGLVSVTGGDSTTAVWPNNPTEIADIVLEHLDGGLDIKIAVNFAADIGPYNSAEVLMATLSLFPGDLETLRQQWPDWASRYGLTSPGDAPSWMHGSGIYEVQIGTSYFWNDNSYCRYPEIRDLTSDLDRVAALGFSVIQLMPRQPYPSYNVHDYADITTSYGDEAELAELVAKCHARGIRVILDVLLHGVLDNESIDAAVEGVVNGPLYDTLDEEVLDTFGSDVSDSSNYWIAWSRHILDFSDHWRAGSPARTPLQESHPDWFATDSAGAVSGVYTKAFDARNPEWQRYFRAAMLNLLRRTDADGFRFDAPTYNFFANWAPWARNRAFMSPLGCIPLFVDMRQDIKALKPDALLYTEPSGHLLRRSMDVNYNYDEQWLVSALLDTAHPSTRGVRNARDFMQWMQDRDDFLPVGSQTAHHIDSHDTFWWPQWGKKWRREQYSLQAVRALTAAFLSIDGPYMMFTGGEEGIDDVLTAALAFRAAHSDLWATRVAFDTRSNPSGNLLIAHRGSTGNETLCVVNLSQDCAEKLPASLDSTWSIEAGERHSADTIESYGFVFASRTPNDRTTASKRVV